MCTYYIYLLVKNSGHTHCLLQQLPDPSEFFGPTRLHFERSFFASRGVLDPLELTSVRNRVGRSSGKRAKKSTRNPTDASVTQKIGPFRPQAE